MSDAARRAIDAVNRRFEAAANRGDFAAMAEVYADDARLLPPDAPIVSGKAAIADFWRAAGPALNLRAVRLETLEIDVAGDRAVEIGTAYLTLAEGAARMKYVVAWRRGADGEWRFAVDIWNAMPT